MVRPGWARWPGVVRRGVAGTGMAGTGSGGFITLRPLEYTRHGMGYMAEHPSNPWRGEAGTSRQVAARRGSARRGWAWRGSAWQGQGTFHEKGEGR